MSKNGDASLVSDPSVIEESSDDLMSKNGDASLVSDPPVIEESSDDLMSKNGDASLVSDPAVIEESSDDLMSTNGDENSDSDPSVAEESSDDGYSIYDGIEYLHYVNPIMRYVPTNKRSDVRKLCKDTARIYERREPIKRMAVHYKTIQEQTETCMQEDCNKLTLGKCGKCHVFLCINSENDCFGKFHNIY